jgi:PEP-CTERM motif
MLAMFPASAQVLYENGPINGTTNGWIFDFGFTVSDSFTLLNNSTVGGFEFGAWEYPGDVLSSVDWSITSQENGGTVYGSGTASGNNLTDKFISTNQSGFDIDEITVAGLNVGLNGGTYWLNLLDAQDPRGDPTYWDENSGAGCMSNGCPSKAYEFDIGTVPSESFTITGSGGGTTPEPSSFLLLASGVIGLGGVLRRKLL